jgi:hypothetical protein
MQNLTLTQWGAGTLVESDGNRLAFIDPAGKINFYRSVPSEIKVQIRGLAKDIGKAWNLDRYWEAA